MGLRDSLEAKAKKWALDKANDLLGDKSQSAAETAPPPPPPPPPVDQRAVAEAQADVGERVARRLFPGLGEWADQQQARFHEREAAEAAKRRAAVAALPKAEVKIALSGAVDAHWWGQLPVRLEVQEPPAVPEDWRARDPFVGQPTLVVEVVPYDDQRPVLGPKPMSSWRITVPAYHGDDRYDLVALVRQRNTAGFDAPYDDTWIDLGTDDDTDFQCWFYADAGPSSVTVSDGGRVVAATVSMAGAVGTVVGTLELSLPPRA